LSGQERRRHPRVPVDVPVRILDKGKEHQARLRDICRDAALVEALQSWPLESELDLEMALPGVSEVIEVKGRVIRLEAEGQRFALLFTDVTPLAGMRIDFFVALQTDLGGTGSAPS
jgi:PilZ domain